MSSWLGFFVDLILICTTYTWELDAAVTALWSGTLLLEVKVTELSTWGLNDADLVGGGVIPDGEY